MLYCSDDFITFSSTFSFFIFKYSGRGRKVKKLILMKMTDEVMSDYMYTRFILFDVDKYKI